MAGVITSSDTFSMLQETIRKVTEINIKEYPALYKEVFETLSSDHAFEIVQGWVGMSSAQRRGEGEVVQLDDMREGLPRMATHDFWSKKFAITLEQSLDNKYMDLAKQGGLEMAKCLRDAKNRNGFAFLNNATSTTGVYAGKDGKALLASDHPLIKGGTYSNILSSDFSELALEQASIQAKYWTDEGGIPQMVNFKSLIIPEDLRFEASRILESDGRVGTADNDLNALKTLKVVPKVVPVIYLTDSDSWFLMTDVPDSFMLFEHSSGMMSDYYKDNATKNHIYDMMQRYVFTFNNPRGTIGSVGI